MAGEPTNVASSVAIGFEAVTGTQAFEAVKGQVYLDLLSESLEGNSEVIERRTANGVAGITKAVPGKYTAGGDLNFDVTPDKCSKLFLALFGKMEANPATQAPISHMMYPCTLPDSAPWMLPLTVIKRIGDFWRVFPNQRVSRISLRPGTEDVMTAAATLVGAGPRVAERLYNVATNLYDVGAVYSTEDSFVFYQGAFTLGGTVNDATGNWEFTFEREFETKFFNNGARGPSKIAPGDFIVSGSFDLAFDSEAQLKLWLQSVQTTWPLNVGQGDLQTATILALYTSGTNFFKIEIPKAYNVGPAGVAIQSKQGFLVQKVQFRTLWSLSDAYPAKVTIQNGETDAVLSAVGTPIA